MSEEFFSGAAETAGDGIWSDEGEWEWRNTTVAKSFRLGGGALEARSQIDLGGFVVDIQATPEVLMVARTDWQQNDGRSAVALIDISSPEGDMVEGGEILAITHTQAPTPPEVAPGGSYSEGARPLAFVESCVERDL